MVPTRICVLSLAAVLVSQAVAQYGTNVDAAVLDACSGYNATDISTTEASLSARLTLAGDGCNVFGLDISTLALVVEYETGEHALIPSLSL